MSHLAYTPATRISADIKREKERTSRNIQLNLSSFGGIFAADIDVDSSSRLGENSHPRVCMCDEFNFSQFDCSSSCFTQLSASRRVRKFQIDETTRTQFCCYCEVGNADQNVRGSEESIAKTYEKSSLWRWNFCSIFKLHFMHIETETNSNFHKLRCHRRNTFVVSCMFHSFLISFIYFTME